LETRPEAGNVQPEIRRRRRRTRTHRRNLLIRRVLAFVVFFGFAFGLSTVALRHLTPSLFRASNEPDRRSAEASRNRVLAVQEEALHSLDGRTVYPYSVVPGGIKDAAELKWVADHDPVVALHYVGFDYARARIVRLLTAHTVYLSYRIGNKIYWTHRLIRLKAGETLLTDGKITARTRCANRVEEVPQQATSASEPPPAKFDEPAAPNVGTATGTPPVPFQSALLNRNPLPGLGPALPIGVYDPLNGEPVVPITPPELPGVCGPISKKPVHATGAIRVESGGKAGKKVNGGNPCGGGIGEVPEPGTWLLMGTGLAFILWMGKSRFARTPIEDV
jgi:hypothetical protein